MKLIVVPTAANPLKDGPAASFADRAAMLVAMLNETEVAVVSQVEADQEGPAYTVDTIERLKPLFADEIPVLLVGADAWQSLPDWRQPRRLLEMVDIAVFSRDGELPAGPESVLKMIDPNVRICYDANYPSGCWIARFVEPNAARDHVRIQFLNADIPHISSTMLRSQLAHGHVPPGDVPPTVRQVIEERGLYGF